MTHAFFADMGGFRLDAPGLEKSIPIDGEQLVYLVKHKFLEYPNVTKGDIEDRDKADVMSRYVWSLNQYLLMNTFSLTVGSSRLYIDYSPSARQSGSVSTCSYAVSRASQ